MHYPLVSIVTPSFNSGEFIAQTIESVLTQDYQHIEYFVIDGGSTDNTLKILDSYNDSRMKWISERDRGQSDAVNKGWSRAAGEILGWLNADDVYFPNAVQIAVNYFLSHPQGKWLYGQFVSFDKHGQPMPYRIPIQEWDYGELLNVNYIVQPSVFLRRELFEEVGGLRLDLHYTMDYEYWLRMGKQHPGHYVPDVRVGVRMYRETKTSTGGIQRLDEIENVVAEYGGTVFPRGHQHEWVRTYCEKALEDALQGRWTEFVESMKRALKFPNAFPRGFIKVLFRRLIPTNLETTLRQILIRRRP